MKVPNDDVAHCFGVTANDGRRSSVWRLWSCRNDVYLCPRAKREEFKISLHKPREPGQPSWRMAYDKEYAKRMRRLGTWKSDRCFERISRPPTGHAIGFARGVRMYFPESELRAFTEGWDESRAEPILRIPAAPQNSVCVVDLVYTEPFKRITGEDWPLKHYGSKKVVHWALPDGETVWLVYFYWSAVASELAYEAKWFRSNSPLAIKLDERPPCSVADNQSGRIMIAGVNERSWFCVIDAAARSNADG